jgi:hypothetical protein
LGYLRGVAFLRAFEKHVFHAMRDARARVLFFMQAARLDPHLYADKRVRVILTDDDLQAVWQSGDAGVRRGDGEGAFCTGRRTAQNFFHEDGDTRLEQAEDGRNGSLNAVAKS